MRQASGKLALIGMALVVVGVVVGCLGLVDLIRVVRFSPAFFHGTWARPSRLPGDLVPPALLLLRGAVLGAAGAFVYARATPAAWRPPLALLGVSVLALCLVLVARYGGWLVFLFGPLYLLALALHAATHARAIRSVARGHPRPGSLIALALVSHALLVGGFLAQHDAGDGSGWLYFTAILEGTPGNLHAEPPAWWPRDSLAMNAYVFAPVAVSWVSLWLAARAGRRRTRSDAATSGAS